MKMSMGVLKMGLEKYKDRVYDNSMKGKVGGDSGRWDEDKIINQYKELSEDTDKKVTGPYLRSIDRTDLLGAIKRHLGGLNELREIVGEDKVKSGGNPNRGNKSDNIIEVGSGDITSDSGFWAWFSGFFDGEGALCMNVRYNDDYRYNYTVSVGLEVTQHLTDNTVESMVDMVDELGVGKLYNRTRDGRQNQLRWYTHNSDVVYEVVDNMIPYMVIKKDEAKEFLKLCKMIVDGEHKNKSGLLKAVKKRDMIRNKYRTELRSDKKMSYNYLDVRREL